MTSPNAPATTASAGRRRTLAFTLVATLAATVWAAAQDDASSDAASEPRRARPDAASIPSTVSIGSTGSATMTVPTAAQDWPELPRVDARPAWNDPLPQGLSAWGPPPPPPAPAPPPTPRAAASAPPAPPAFPYTLIGRIDDGQVHALLSNRQRSFGVVSKDVIDDTWRIDAIDADGVTLTWLPGNVTRTLAFPSS